MREMGAYEWLWSQESDRLKPTFKAVAELFRNNPGAMPSDLVDEESALACARQVLERFERSGVRSFSVRLNGIGDYPDTLRDAEYPLEMLYFQGEWDLAHSPKRVAIVGTRNPSDEGVRRTRKLVKALKGDQINWYAELRDTDGALKRNDKDSPDVALQLFGNWVAARLREIDLCDVTLVPVPLSSCTSFAQVTTPIRMARGRAF